MTSNEMKEALALILEYAITGMVCLDDRQKQLISRFAEEMLIK